MSGAPSPSPRPSLSFRSPASSSRTSLDLPAGTSSTVSRATTSRRNRAALRDYYNIKPSGVGEDADAQSSTPPPDPAAESHSPLSELDREGFDAGAYVRKLLEQEGLEGILKVENELVGEIRGLDGDRKALVYDNYSKLISATDTIKRMRTNMDPLAPTTSTLAPAISHIAQTAATLSSDLATHVPTDGSQSVLRQSKARQTVQWVLGAPDRLEQLLLDDKRDEAQQDWAAVRNLLDKWKGVPGVDEIRESCQKALNTVEG
ncbi:uncharacterized protein PV09_07651 [Verruconis gallopava]|uniref:Vacuolar protein sorting-associated protein 51 homolog n=1 Tax=Verruconis gallopava TaxID=253628 RepID=A0A0D2AP58_9PEZI|nr:uncharacterized protein PV09_07651 [Verruconis gallopava]KIW00904.1 hypothetical protein PV09_07651 [Verruconis gallopava]